MGKISDMIRKKNVKPYLVKCSIVDENGMSHHDFTIEGTAYGSGQMKSEVQKRLKLRVNKVIRDKKKK